MAKAYPHSLTRRQWLKVVAAAAGSAALQAGCLAVGVTPPPENGVDQPGEAALKPQATSTAPAAGQPAVDIPTASPSVQPLEAPTADTPTQAAAEGQAAEGQSAPSTPQLSPEDRTHPRVVQVHHTGATHWDFNTGFFWEHIDQSIVDAMTEAGLLRLTGQSSLEAAWQFLLPGYTAGKVIAIKVNFNNCRACDAQDNVIDGVIEPVNALIRGMLAAGVNEADIWVFDNSRRMPARFVEGCLYRRARFIARDCWESEPFNYENPDPSTVVSFQQSGLKPRLINEVLLKAAYVINMPIVKDHGITGVTLGFKNFFGVIDRVVGGGDDDLHQYIDPKADFYSPDENPMVTIFQNVNIQSKLVLTVGDGLFGALENTHVTPKPWRSFGNLPPNSLFFATDPVAADCVMLDILDTEPGSHPNRKGADNYLRVAERVGSGVYERALRSESADAVLAYQRIDYQRVELG